MTITETGTSAETDSKPGGVAVDGPVDPEVAEAYTHTMAALEEAGTAQNRKVYGRHGAAMPMFGVSYAVQNKLAKKIRRDHALAQALWASGNHDARVLALKVADPAQVDEPMARRWVADVNNYILAEALGGLCSQSPVARALSDAWRDNPHEWPAATGWFIIACTAANADMWAAPELEALVSQIEAEIHGRPNRVRHEMNGALIAIALRDDGDIRQSALAAARRIGTVDVDHGETSCKTPPVEPYVKKTLEYRAKQAERRKAAQAKRKAK